MFLRMKIIDKHLLHTLMVPLAYCLAAFMMIFIVFDLFDNLGDFIDAGTPALDVFKYYVLLMPSLVVYVIPVSLMLAVLYSLSRLTKNNELTAMRASGIGLFRLLAPFVAVGIISSAGVVVIHETIGPWSAYWTNQYVRSQRHKGKLEVYISQNLAFNNARKKRNWLIESFDTRSNLMVNVTIIQQRPDLSDDWKITARRGEWLDGRWWLTDLVKQAYDPNGHPLGPPQFERMMEMTDFNETPQTFINERKDPSVPEQFSSREFRTFLKTHREISGDTVARIMVDMHHRLALPWMCLIVVLLGIPCGTHTGRKGALLGIAIALSLFFAYYILMNLCLALGKKQVVEPWLAAWTPNIIFFMVSVIANYRMR